MYRLVDHHLSDIVVSACDGHTTMTKFLPGRYLNEAYRRLYTETITEPGMVFPGYFIVFLGLKRPLPGVDPCTTLIGVTQNPLHYSTTYPYAVILGAIQRTTAKRFSRVPDMFDRLGMKVPWPT